MSTHIINRLETARSFVTVTLTIACGSVAQAVELHRSISRDVVTGATRITLINAETEEAKAQMTAKAAAQPSQRRRKVAS